jgi:hypothetical protein
LSGADLADADLRRTDITGARVDGASFTGAKLNGIVGTGAPIRNVRAEWVDASIDGNGSRKAHGDEVTALLMGRVEAPIEVPVAANKRFFGRGDVLRDAKLEFGAGAYVEIESVFERCTISLGEGTELVVGEHGVLSGCQIEGAGRVTVHGKFVELQTPGVVGITQLCVSAGGSFFGAVAQPPDDHTEFAFEPGCVLRLKITHAKTMNGRTAQ